MIYQWTLALKLKKEHLGQKPDIFNCKILFLSVGMRGLILLFFNLT